MSKTEHEQGLVHTQVRMLAQRCGNSAHIPRYNNKPVHLSQQIRLANLAQGARLELVQASRSPAPITVALQLPEKRLTKKLPNNISLWEILRQFESDEGANFNFTQRAVPEMDANGESGAGRLNYEMPVITVLPDHKKYSSFVELQKTLSQIGFDRGSVLLKLGFENSGTPLEEAMTQITQYFKSAEPAASGAHAQSTAQTSSIPDPATAAPEATTTVMGETIRLDESDPVLMDVDEKAPAESSPEPTFLQTEGRGDNAEEIAPPQSSPPHLPTQPSSPSNNPRNIQVFAASTSPTPQAARYAYNEADYIPTVEHAKIHQASLTGRGRNTRLLSDKELDEQEKTRQEKLQAAADKGGKVRLRFPDGTLIEANISKTDTALDLFDLATGFLQEKNEPYQLLRRDLKNPSRMTGLVRDAKFLFKDLGLWNSEMVTFRWDEGASEEVRSGGKSVLSEEWRRKAEPIKVDALDGGEAEAEAEKKTTGSKSEGKKKVELSNAEKEARLKNILKGGMFGKKK
jgi:tether containing UBX domain for GLUT4